MTVSVKARAWFLVVLVIALSIVILLLACSKPAASPAAKQPAISSEPSRGKTPPASPPQTTAVTPRVPDSLQPSRVEVVYFHMPWRCAACNCFEDRISYVVNTYFQDELAGGRMTFAICNLADRQKAPLFRKYDAFASQLFINTVVNNTDNIKNIEDIWKWHCEKDKPGFDAKVRDVVEQALKEIS